FALMNMGDFRDDGRRFITEYSLSLSDRWILSRLNRVVKVTQQALTDYQFADAASALYQFLWGEFCDWYIELAKSSLTGNDENAKKAVRAVLVHCLDTVLRLLHPFMPFITEEIWQKLPITRATESICIASYPVDDPRLDDAKAEAEMQPIIDVIDAVRAIRGESNVKPVEKIEAQVQSGNAAIRASVDRWRSYIMPLAGLSKLTVDVLGPKPPQAAADVRADMEIYVPLAGIVDLAEERARMQKEIVKAEQEMAGITKRFENKSFIDRAPADVVEKDRARLAELKQRVEKVSENLKRIAPVEVRIAPPSSGTMNLGEELKAELSQVNVSGPDEQVKEALDKLREGTKEGLSPRDHMDLGVAYMNMGLVDDAVREFNAAKTDGEGDRPTAKKAPPAKRAPAKKVAAKKKPAPTKKKPAPAKKVAAKKKPAPAKKKAASRRRA
ncbi:MAG: class I tRNA ligase family protein, partial [Archangium sp.]|nr:class I tRNA ligase family protein [Archangium sp.]